MNKKYQHHKIQSTNASGIREILSTGLTTDRTYMKEQMNPHLDYIEAKGIQKIKDFIQSLHDCGCRKDNQQKIIKDFVVHMKKTKNINIFLLKKRELTKANASERNILMNRLAIQHPDDFFTFIKEFISLNIPQKQNTNDYIRDIQEMINQLFLDSTSVLNDPISCDQAFEPDDSFDSIFNSDQSDVFTESFYESNIDEISFMEDSQFTF